MLRKGNRHSKQLTGHSRTLRWYLRVGSGRLMSVLRLLSALNGPHLETFELFSKMKHKHFWLLCINMTGCHSGVGHFDINDRLI